MSFPWRILIALTIARFSMGFQFQSVPALGSSLVATHDLSFSALGTLIGAYLLPGVAAALTGGWLGQRFGDARIFFWGLGLMVLGGFMGAFVSDFTVALTARLIAGTGAVAVNVMVTKMAADWFQGRDDLPTAMGVLVSSWPAGIALAALSLPLVSESFGVKMALSVPAVLSAAALLLVVTVWREPQRPQKGAQAHTPPFVRREIILVGLAGTIWGLYNVALVGAIAWLPGLLERSGYSVVAAAASASMIGWAAIASVAAGGWLSVRSRHRDAPALVCFAGSGVLLLALPFLGAAAGSFAIVTGLGLLIGLAAAMNMTLPLEAARPEKRTMAMGLYFAIYYGFMGIAPWALGTLRDTTESPAAPLYMCAGLLALCLLMWLAFRLQQRQSR